ncbi:MAG: ABC transporter ATP-binding protein [Caldilineaceae bacterium]
MNAIIRLLQMIQGRRRRQMALTVLFGLLFSATTLVPPLLIRRLILWITDGAAASGSLTWIVALLLAVYLVRGVCRYYYGQFSHRVAYQVLDDLLVRVYRHLQTLSHRFYNQQRTGSLIARSINDIDAIEDFIAHGVPDLVMAVIIPLAMLGVLFTLSPWLTLIVIIPLPVAALVIYRFTGNIRAMWRRVRSGSAALIAQVQDSFAGVTEIKSFGQEAAQAQAIAMRSAEFRDASIAANKVSLLPAGIVEVTGGLGMLLAVWIGGRFALAGSMNVADLFVFVSYLGHIYQPFLKLADIGDVLHKAAASCERVFELLDVKPDIVNPSQPLTPTQPTWSIEFRHVSFSYNDEPVLHDLSFQVAPGEMVALVGATGAGKTTISRLVERFYDPQAGAVLVSGHDLRSLDLDFLRRNIAAVMQDVFLFHGTVRQNILFGRPTASEAELIAAAQAANAAEFIDQLPQGYDTIIGERGVRLSGGQKQRLSIARALLKDAPILILDEATSAVDVETEGLIQQAIARLTQQRTTLVIAHRLSTIRHADKILVLDHGRIVEMGAHEALLNQQGHYARMVRAQNVAEQWELRRELTAPAQAATQRNGHHPVDANVQTLSVVSGK